VAAIFVFGYFYPLYYKVGIVVALSTLMLVLADFVLLYSKSGLAGKREVARILSNGNPGKCILLIQNNYAFPVYVQVLDEIPEQLGLRELVFPSSIMPFNERRIEYVFTPKVRGEYSFGDIVVFCCSPLRLVQRRILINGKTEISVLPSYVYLTGTTSPISGNLRRVLVCEK
jgi:uncharacterized protein (DUF58 family)